MMRYLTALISACFLSSGAVADQVFIDSEQLGVKEIVPNDDTAIMLYVRDMDRGVDAFILCPDPDTLVRIRGSVWANDIEGVAQGISGKGCFVANDGWGRLTAVHSQSMVRIEFWWLVGSDFDTGVEERLDRSGREYWVYSFQVGTTGDNQHVGPVIESAFK